MPLQIELQCHYTRILEFHPPPFSLVYELVIRSVLYPAPTVTLEIAFGVSVTVEYALVLDSKGIREAVQEGNPIKALNSFAFRDTFDGVDKPLVVFEISVTASVSVSAVIVKIGVSGGITIIIEFDFYDPNPATSGGLIRPFELINISPNPLDWFEVTIKAYATISFYVQVGIFLGFIDIILYEYRVEFNIIIIDALKITPKLKGRVATKGPTGVVTVFCDDCGDNRITCKHISGGSGDETVQCWQTEKEYPIIGYFEQVSSLVAPESLELTINCIASAFDISNNVGVVLNYEQCKIFSDAGLTIGGEFVSATEGPIKIANNLEHGTIYLPKPAQDFLTVTISQECNAKWTLRGDAALTIMGSQLQDDCEVEALDGKQESVLRVDLTPSTSACGKTNVRIDLSDNKDEPRGMVHINEKMRVKFDSTVYTDIVIADESVADCNNYIHVMKLSSLVKSVKISTSRGDDTVVIGTQGKSFEEFIHGNINIDGGSGSEDKIIVHDGSIGPKNQTLTSTYLSGIQARTNETTTFFYFGIEHIDLNLGGYVNAEVSAEVNLMIRYNNNNSNKIRSTSMVGALHITSIGNSDEAIRVRKSKGPVTIDFGDGDHIIDISDSSGDVTIQTSDGNINVSVHSVQGDLGIACLNKGNGFDDRYHFIDISNSFGDVTIQTLDSKNNVSVHSVQGNLSIECLNTGHDFGDNVIEISNSFGDVTIQTSNSNSDVSTEKVDGDLSIDCLNSGNDRIEANLIKGDQKIVTNAGNDTIIIHSVHRESMLTIIAGDVGANPTGNDNNRIEIDGLLEANALITGGHGSDVIILNNATEAILMEESSSKLIQRDRSLKVSSKSASSYFLNISTGTGKDELHIKTTPSCSMEIDTGDDNDSIHIYGLGFGTNATVLGGSGNDNLTIDGRDGGLEHVKNTMDGTSLNWNGGLGEDILETYFVSAGNTKLTLFDDKHGPNTVIINCANISCVVLSRDTFLANM